MGQKRETTNLLNINYKTNIPNTNNRLFIPQIFFIYNNLEKNIIYLLFSIQQQQQQQYLFH
ncbi:hypothetical protein Mgra_00006744 [Meloidogyne graminicola]|uniref:Uncharacterized protein n=1 Tax=Meloidogyne graminicola TaxID=189291 RepID=A0A8S9ZKH6_9BILA|nr:hypothetical protein Mgra_00006744 [Meloidogyne graminicola]